MRFKKLRKLFSRFGRRAQLHITEKDIADATRLALGVRYRSPEMFRHVSLTKSLQAIDKLYEDHGIRTRVKRLPVAFWKKSSTTLLNKLVLLSSGFYDKPLYTQVSTKWHEFVHTKQDISKRRWARDPVYRWSVEMPAYAETVAFAVMMSEHGDVRDEISRIVSRMHASYGLHRIPASEVHDATRRVLERAAEQARERITKNAKDGVYQ